MYRIICHEEIQGNGPICWSGEQEYQFDDLDEAIEFVTKRMSVLNKPDQDHWLMDEDGTPSGQYVVTKAITSIEEKPGTAAEMDAVQMDAAQVDGDPF